MENRDFDPNRNEGWIEKNGGWRGWIFSIKSLSLGNRNISATLVLWKSYETISGIVG